MLTLCQNASLLDFIIWHVRHVDHLGNCKKYISTLSTSPPPPQISLNVIFYHILSLLCHFSSLFLYLIFTPSPPIPVFLFHCYFTSFYLNSSTDPICLHLISLSFTLTIFLSPSYNVSIIIIHYNTLIETITFVDIGTTNQQELLYCTPT